MLTLPAGLVRLALPSGLACKPFLRVWLCVFCPVAVDSAIYPPFFFFHFTDAPLLLPARSLIIGHSILFWALRWAKPSGPGSWLGLGARAVLFWRVKRGMLWGQFLPTFLQFIKEHLPPQILLLHLGENDLAQRKFISLRVQIRQDLSQVKQLCPGIRIVWSYFLPRRVWKGANSICNIDGTRKRVNSYVAHFVRAGRGKVVSHP